MTLVQPLPPKDPTMDASKNHYWTYHSLPTLLGCKQPLTASLDEDLFIAVHQMCELAFHQMIIDLDRALDATRPPAAGGAGEPGDVPEARYFLRRVNAMWRSVNATMPILNTMRAFAEFRTSIGPTSGFQSAQFRRIEIMSGVAKPYWHGGTNDAEGKPHIAETTFNHVYGKQVQESFERYAAHNLVTLCRRVFDRGAADAEARGLLDELAEYDRNQSNFHQAHLALAVNQLRKVGVEVGTGGTSFKTYLASYAAQHAPLFPWLAQS
jgi:tryptophan 2,3-dioxygenase